MPYIESNSSPSAALFDLVKSLNSSEKRYFKLVASLQKGEKNYLRLFDAVDAQTEYDEEEIREQFRDEPFARQLHVAKGYLYNLILKSLRTYHARLSVEMRIRDLLADTRILYERGLGEQCRQTLDKAKKLAEEHERHTDLLEIIALHDRCFRSVKPPEEIFRERQEILDRLQNLYEYDLLGDEISKVVIESGKARTEDVKEKVRGLLAHPLLQNEERALSRSALQTCYYVRSSVHYAIGEKEEALHWAKKRQEIIGDGIDTIAAAPYAYAAILINILALHQGKDPEGFERYLEEFRTLPERLAAEGFRSPLFSYWVFNNASGLGLSHLLALGKFDEALRAIPGVHSELAKAGKLVRQVDRLRFNYLTAYTLFGAGNYREALCYVQKVLETPRGNPRRDVLYTMRLIELLIYFELKEYPLFEYKLQALQRFLSRQGRLLAFETILLKALRQLPGYTHSNMTRNWFRELYDKLSPLRSDPLEQPAFDYFNYLAWLRSKIDGISLAEGIKREREEEKMFVSI